MTIGWHNILWPMFQSKQTLKIIKNHTIRRSLEKVWKDCRHIFYGKIPSWYSPNEVISRRLAQGEQEMTYAQILEDKGTLKSREELKLDWWRYRQLLSKFEIDKKEYGIMTELTEFDIIILEAKKKLLSKIYKFLWNNYMADEDVKVVMTRQSQNIGENIAYDKWEQHWKNTNF